MKITKGSKSGVFRYIKIIFDIKFEPNPKAKSLEEILLNLFLRYEADLHSRSCEKLDFKQIFQRRSL